MWCTLMYWYIWCKRWRPLVNIQHCTSWFTRDHNEVFQHWLYVELIPGKVSDQVNDCCCLTTGDARVWNVHTPQLLHTFSACCNSKQRVVAILISRKTSFTVPNTITDRESLHYGSVFMIVIAGRGYPVHSLLLFLSSHQQQSENTDHNKPVCWWCITVSQELTNLAPKEDHT